MIRLARPDVGDDEVAAASEVLRSGQLVQGPHVAAFEQELARQLGLGHLAAVANGTAALHLALLAVGIRPGDKVAVPTFSWPATANVVELVGGVSVFVDIEKTTYGMSPTALSACLERHPDVRAIMPVHAFGAMAQVKELLSIANAHGIPLIEDAACALGASFEGRQAGTWGALGCYSFHPRKAITTGEGGAITTSSPEHLRTLRALRNHGLDPDAPRPDFVLAGFNYRLSEMQAAVGLVQVRKLGALIDGRRRLAACYDRLLGDMDVARPRELSAEAHVYQSYVILLPAALAPGRASLIARLRDAGVETTIGTYHMPLLTYFREKYGHVPGDHPVGEDVAARALALPIHSGLSEHDVATVVTALREAM